jgi:hypothetical protein
MKKLILFIAVVIGLSSCTKEEYVYNHCYTFDKSKFGYGSNSFSVDHPLNEQEKKDWCYIMNTRVVENQKRINPNITMADIDTSYVYMFKIVN